MGGQAPFYVQLDEHLRRRLWTKRDLIDAIKASNGRSAGPCEDLEEALSAIFAGQLAPTEEFGTLVANLLIGRPEDVDHDQLRAREELIGAAYVAESHGRRQQPPYINGVIGRESPSNSASTIDLSETRQAKVNEQQRHRLLRRLAELEDKQARKRTRQAANGKTHRVVPKRRRPTKSARSRHWPSVSAETWDKAATESLAFLPPQARRGDPARETSFMELVARSFQSGHRFAQFLEALLVAWRSEQPTSRGRVQARMSPEQLGACIGLRNRSRYSSHRQQQAWFRRHKGPGVTGNALRNYLSGHSERPLRECLQKMVYAFVPEGDVALEVELRLWRMAASQQLIHPASIEELLDVLDLNPARHRSLEQVLKQYTNDARILREARRIAVDVEEHGQAFTALADEAGYLLTPLLQPQSNRLIVDFARVLPTDGSLQNSIDVALTSGRRCSLMRALIDSSGMPITRIAELTQVHESLFQQWMREGPNRRIEDRERAARIVYLLNPPGLARWPLTAERIAQQNEESIRFLTTNIPSLNEALNAAQQSTAVEARDLNSEGRRTFRAASLLRQVFGRDSLSNLTGPQVGRLLARQGLGDEQVFKHLREGIRDGGRKAARRASLEQAHFLADLLEESLGGLENESRLRFVECVACVKLDSIGNLLAPAQLLRQVQDPKSPLTVRAMTKEMMRRRGGLVHFSREVGVSQQSIRNFITRRTHFLHHPVARRLAERGMGFARGGEEHRQFVIMTTAAWKKRGRPVHVRLSTACADYLKRLRGAQAKHQVRLIRAETMGTLLAQPALSPSELARQLGVTRPVLAGWTTARIGHFTSQRALDRFASLMEYEAEQVSFIQEEFGPA